MRNLPGGLVETRRSIDSPPLTLCFEAYPSIQGERKPSIPSTRTRVSCQSLAPSRAFSRAMRVGSGFGPSARAGCEHVRRQRAWKIRSRGDWCVDMGQPQWAIKAFTRDSPGP